ncbi:Neuroligin-1 [Gryllus bimaculatus]|nr:Neuroligin-1 [Gryllus bimaculatus]
MRAFSKTPQLYVKRKSLNRGPQQHALGAAPGGGSGGGGGGGRGKRGRGRAHNNLLRKLASSHYQSYTTALTVTIAVGCFLLLLNILIFAGIYHQRDRGGGGGAGGGAGGAAGGSGFGSKKKDELAEAGSCSSSSGDGHHFEAKHALLVDHLPLSASQQHLHRGGGTVELPIQEFKASPTAALKRQLLQAQQQAQQEQHQQQQQQQQQQFVNPGPSPRGSPPPTRLTSPSIPDPPPPPKHQPPTLCNQAGASGGILRQQGCPQTPGTMKKRVQIQEISV